MCVYLANRCNKFLLKSQEVGNIQTLFFPTRLTLSHFIFLASKEKPKQQHNKIPDSTEENFYFASENLPHFTKCVLLLTFLSFSLPLH